MTRIAFSVAVNHMAAIAVAVVTEVGKVDGYRLVVVKVVTVVIEEAVISVRAVSASQTSF